LHYRFEELGRHTFQTLINGAMSNNKLAELLELSTDREALQSFFVPCWTEVFDDFYVERHVIQGTMLRLKSEIEQVAQYYRHKASGVGETGKPATGSEIRIATADSLHPSPSMLQGMVDSAGIDNLRPKPPEFKLFGFQQKEAERAAAKAAKPKLPPYEVRVLENLRPPEKFARIADQCTEAEKECIEAAKKGKKVSTLAPDVRDRNRERERHIPFKEFTATKTRETLPRLMEEQRLREAAARMPEPLPRKGPEEVRDQLSRVQDKVELKMTLAARQREYALYKKYDAEEEAHRMAREQALRDDSEFVAWKRRMEAQDKAEREALIAQRKLDLMLGDQHAKDARRKQEAYNMSVSRQYRAEMDVWRGEFASECEKQVQEKRVAIETLRIALKQDPAAAVARVSKAKSAVAAAVKTESEENEKMVAVQMELEQERRRALIAEIKETHARFVERRRKERQTFLEKTSDDLMTGKLQGMTIPELHEALRKQKEEFAVWEDAQRAKIVENREKRTMHAVESQKYIEEVRARRRSKKDLERDERDRIAEEARANAMALEEHKLAELQAKLQAKREERHNEAQKRRLEERQRRVAAQMLSADAGAIEAAKWQEMERGAQNSLLAKQNRRLADMRVVREVSHAETSRRETNLQRRHDDVHAKLEESDVGFFSKREIASAQAATDAGALKAGVTRMRDTAQERFRAQRLATLSRTVHSA